MIEIITEITAIVLSVTSQLMFLGVIVFAITIFLRTPNTNKNNNKNFAYVDKPKGFFTKELKIEAFFPLFNSLMLYAGGGAFLAFLGSYSYELALPASSLQPFLSELPFAAIVVIILLIVDLMSYLAHRFMHAFLWYYHAVHHAAEEMSWLTTVRLHPVEKIIFLFTGGGLITYLLGTDETVLYALAIAGTIDGLYNMFVHLNLQLEYPKWLRYIFVSPNMHRWHHARDEVEAYDKNFATVFSFYDVLLGTYYHPEGKLPNACGVKNAINKDIFPKTFIGHILYPFKWHAYAIKKRLFSDNK